VVWPSLLTNTLLEQASVEVIAGKAGPAYLKSRQGQWQLNGYYRKIEIQLNVGLVLPAAAKSLD